MQKHRDGTIVVCSATDLVGFLACEHLITLELGRRAGLARSPSVRDEPELRGARRPPRARLPREAAGAGRQIVEIPPKIRWRDTAGAAGRGRADDRRAGRRAPRSSYQATFSTAGGAGTPTSWSASGRPSRSRRLELRGRGHEARPAHQGQARSSRWASTPSCWGRSRARPRDAHGRHRRRRPPRPPLRRLRRLPSPGQGPLRERGSSGEGARRARPTPTRSSTAGSAAGGWTA